jgi:medium-chain acyl-[acyl-carrier-protein] hydrolase
MTETQYIQEFEVRAYEMDYTGLAKPETLFNYLQEAAAQHAHRLGLSVPELNKKNLTWVLSRYHIRIHRYPAWAAKVTVRTWPSHAEGLFAVRDFQAVDEKGPVASATSSWMILNLATKKPVPVVRNLPDYPLNRERALDDPFPSLPDLERADLENVFPVLQNDLDFNRHVNNAVYIRWGLEGVPRDVLLSCRPKSVEITYRRQVFYGDRIQSRIQNKAEGPEMVFLHQLCNAEDGRELARLRTSWK